MSCRCGELRECSVDLSRVSDAERRIRSIKDIRESAAQSLYQIANACPQVFDSSGVEELWGRLTALTEAFEERIEEAKRTLSQMSEEVADRQERYAREDANYHDDEGD